jgi:hypothetical protein
MFNSARGNRKINSENSDFVFLLFEVIKIYH